MSDDRETEFRIETLSDMPAHAEALIKLRRAFYEGEPFEIKTAQKHTRAIIEKIVENKRSIITAAFVGDKMVGADIGVPLIDFHPTNYMNWCKWMRWTGHQPEDFLYGLTHIMPSWQRKGVNSAVMPVFDLEVSRQGWVGRVMDTPLFSTGLGLGGPSAVSYFEARGFKAVKNPPIREFYQAKGESREAEHMFKVYAKFARPEAEPPAA